MQKHLLPIFFSLIFTLLCVQGFAQTVAVFEFDCDNKDFDGNIAMMTDLLIHELVKSGDVTVVERKRLDKIMAEYAFQSSPFVDIKTAKKLGKGLGADCIIVGIVAALGCPLYITARMVDVEKGTILHSAKMTHNYWSDYEQKLPAFTGVWTGTLSGDDFEDYYEISFGEKSKCTVKVSTINLLGGETVQEATGTYSCAPDSFSGGKMFRLNALFKGATLPRLRKIEWAYPISMNAEKKYIQHQHLYQRKKRNARPAHPQQNGVKDVLRIRALLFKIFFCLRLPSAVRLR